MYWIIDIFDIDTSHDIMNIEKYAPAYVGWMHFF